MNILYKDHDDTTNNITTAGKLWGDGNEKKC